MAKKKKQLRDGIMYSTNDEYAYESHDDFEEETLPPHQQDLRVLSDRKQRAGKTATLITGYIGKKEDLEDLGKRIKQKCGVGGSVKDGVIIIQGDFKERIMEILLAEQYKAKISGG